MASLRLPGASPVTSRPSMLMVPPLVSSRPAINLSKVDLPQPEGPTKTTNSPFSMTRSMPGMMTVDPKDFDTFLSVMFPMVSSPRARSLLHGAEGQAAHQLLLREPAHDQYGGNGQRRGCRQLRPKQSLRARERADEGGQRRCLGGGQADRPEGFVPGENDVEQHGGGDARHRHRCQHIDYLAPQGRPVHARGLQYLAGDLAEIGVEHPHDDRQVDQHEHDRHADAAIEQVEIAEDE